MTRITVLTLFCALLLSGCSALTGSQTTVDIAEPLQQSIQADEVFQMVTIEDETGAVVPEPLQDSSTTLEQQANQRSELERIRREGEAAQGLVRNAPDYNR